VVGRPGLPAAFATTCQPYWAILAFMETRPDDSKKTGVRAFRGRHALLNAYIDILNRLDGPILRLPEIPARSAIPTREPHSAPTRRHLAAYPYEGHVAALTARLRNFSPL